MGKERVCELHQLLLGDSSFNGCGIVHMSYIGMQSRGLNLLEDISFYSYSQIRVEIKVHVCMYVCMYVWMRSSNISSTLHFTESTIKSALTKLVFNFLSL